MTPLKREDGGEEKERSSVGADPRKGSEEETSEEMESRGKRTAEELQRSRYVGGGNGTDKMRTLTLMEVTTKRKKCDTKKETLE